GRQLDGFCIASSDGDFTPLAARIRGNALAVYGFGAKKAVAAYKAEFDRFYECDTLLAAARKAAPRKATARLAPASPKPATGRPMPARQAAPKPAKRQTAARPPAAAKAPVPVEKILDAIDKAKGPDGWSHMRRVGNALSRAIPGFSARTYGYRTTTDLVRALPDVEIKKVGTETYVRLKH
ncbi:MAG: NYN domain-containing protein, partial [Bauldia sp.]|nr:NYN domain-containing protein [Bauldia sp.]